MMSSSFLSIISQPYAKEALAAASIALLTNFILSKQRIASSHHKAISTKTNPPSIEAVECSCVFPTDELSILNTAWDVTGPKGKFLKGRHGVTHYVVDSVTGDNKGLVVMAHGLGTSLEMYETLSQFLVKEGFEVLRYDFFGHGYSKYCGEDMWVNYTPDMFVDQLEDLIDHVCEVGAKKVIGFVGHSTGGVVGIHAMDRWGSGGERAVIPKIILVSPAIWAEKPFIARLADKIPGTICYLMKKVPAARVIVPDAYMESGEIAFARDPITKKFLHPEQEEKKRKGDLRLFGRENGVEKHPYLAAAIYGINGSCLREDLLPIHREKLVHALTSQASTINVLFLWGNCDAVVPYDPYASTAHQWEKDNKNFKFQTLDNLGHESIFEDSETVAKATLSFLN